jgi:hypothetical protein
MQGEGEIRPQQDILAKSTGVFAASVMTGHFFCQRPQRFSIELT